MNSALSFFFFKNILLTPLLAWGTMHGFIGFTRALNLSSIQKIKKLKVIVLLIVFYTSIPIFYKNNFAFSPLFDLLKELTSSVLLGLIWTWLLLEFSEAIGHPLKNPRLFYLWTLISIMAFGIFSLTR